MYTKRIIVEAYGRTPKLVDDEVNLILKGMHDQMYGIACTYVDPNLYGEKDLSVQRENVRTNVLKQDFVYRKNTEPLGKEEHLRRFNYCLRFRLSNIFVIEYVYSVLRVGCRLPAVGKSVDIFDGDGKLHGELTNSGAGWWLLKTYEYIDSSTLPNHGKMSSQWKI